MMWSIAAMMNEYLEVDSLLTIIQVLEVVVVEAAEKFYSKIPSANDHFLFIYWYYACDFYTIA